MIANIKHLLKDGSFKAQVYVAAAMLYPNMSSLVRERFEREMDWIAIQQLEDGFLEMWNIVEEARHIGGTVGTAHRGLERSLVAYCLGLTNQDPLSNDELPEYPFQDPMLPLNVGVSISSDHRNRLLAMAEPVYGKAMMRNGLPFLKLDGIILDFFRC